MKKFLVIGFCFYLLIGFSGCAKIGSPPGGPKDEDPPVALKSKPANYATNYNKKKVIVKFDEFVKLKDQFNEFTISPPFKKKPIPLIRGKKIVVEIPLSKMDSSTYTLDFGQSIEDNNEGNKLPNFQFVISKNAHIDSFSVKGLVLDAFSLKPHENRINILLHKNQTDTAFQTIIPSYVGRTDPKGNFRINHIAPGKYSVFALIDGNNNYLYDLPSEIIAFYNDPIILDPDSFPNEPDFVDSLLRDSLVVADSIVLNDSTISDTLITSGTAAKRITKAPMDSVPNDSTSTDSIAMMFYGYTFNMYSFQEKEPYNQFLSDFSRSSPERLEIIFNEPLDKSIDLRLLKPDTVGQWFYLNGNELNDTLILWLADSNLVSKDSIEVEITYPETDTMGLTIPVTDTIVFRYKEKGKDKGSKNKNSAKERENDTDEADSVKAIVYRTKLNVNVKKSGQDLHLPIQISSEAPVLKYKQELIELKYIEDTLENPVNYEFLQDSVDKTKFKLLTKFEHSAKYKLYIHEGAITDIYNRTIDSTEYIFTTQRDDYYGQLIMHYEHINSPVIIQLFDKDSKLVQTKYISESQTLRFEYLAPGKYSMKIIFDDNENRKWDTGILAERLQPERVAVFPKAIEVRSNWEVEYTWKLE
ncbi:MAG: Ig-like domain-containing protein [Bacteroidales bacterium]|nr:Ig-like domain-containing protein [Bacteroidales bacterium]MBN2819537.1 Ig-like domain-containing protein [Bacteroidales bacterium]